MGKNFWSKFIIALAVVFIAGLMVYKYFPQVWGDILYPLDYEGYILKYSKEYNLDPTLVAGVIYTESRYNKDSISRVGARGLMQIMPATGQVIADRLGETGFTADSLFDPETNIRYGCWYLNYLFGNYPNNQNAVLAGYNGGGAVGDRYVESREVAIPQETAGFITTVNNAQQMYGQLYADKLSPNTTDENIAEKIKLQQEKQKTWWEKIVENLKLKVKN